jgi:hypothetical protein
MIYITDIPAWTDDNERELLGELSREVPDHGLIVEIGCLYGGTTAALALCNPHAAIISIDDFSWTPEGYPPASSIRFMENMKSIGAHNVTVLEGDSRVIGKTWARPIDFLWIDGGHSYQYVYSDLVNFGEFAKVIALHDYDNPAWPTIKKAVETYLYKYVNRWYLDKVVGMVAVLRRK